MKKSKSSLKWLKEHHKDKFVQKSKQDGFYARSAYKLLEIDFKHRIFAGKTRVVDLGASPGGWSQVVRRELPKAKIFALDMLKIKPIDDVVILQGDFTSNRILAELLACLKNTEVDLILSDMAPNFSGHKEVDIPKVMYLAESVFAFSGNMLAQSGDLVCKVFQGRGFDEIIKSARKHFKKVIVYKPLASRGRSKEVYMVCKDKLLTPLYDL